MAKGKKKVHSLTGRITSKLVFEAWRAVRRNRGAAGIDKVSIQMFEKNLDANLDRLMRELKQRTFSLCPRDASTFPKTPSERSSARLEFRQSEIGLLKRCCGAC